MDKIDKFLTHQVWLIVISAMLGWYYFGPLVGLVTVAMILLIWGIIALGNPSDIVGIIHYKDGTIKRTAIFPKYSDYEKWHDTIMREKGNIINYIEYELYIEED